ncbi:TIGR02452 family protein [Kitasatospora sp. RB6PN24]|uniref:TIGR02452 family protein n=1 Tax=Kitasatospora humi TaxID=2893891 RepID=UPI001E31B912|nr:TIGR02452 family protein [Kitasatospora humi]MCC9309300.1 TIGR02452 family protein [Kitasatospora humi]
MSSRLSELAKRNEEIAGRGSYRVADGTEVVIRDWLAAAQDGTVSYPPDWTGADAHVDVHAHVHARVHAHVHREADVVADADADAVAERSGGPVVEVTAEGSITAARRLLREHGDGAAVGVLNFASARNPGGGYLRGARAQEEDLCRSALLYSCLLGAPDYYAAHRASSDLRYSHRVVFSPGVPVIRDERGELLEQPYRVDFLTSPAPNAGELRARSQSSPAELAELLAERARRVLAVAAEHGVRQLVLGAWGCGVFRNDPVQVAEAFAVALASHGSAFERVVFAVWDRSPQSANRAAFTARFGG